MTGSKIKVVLVEDDPLIMRVYQEALQDRGYEVEVFFNGSDAYAALEKMEKKPLLIISDIMMPQMNGIELLEKLRAIPELKPIPVVFITNLAQMDLAKKGLSLGAIAYLVKGQYTLKELVTKIEEYIDTKKRSDIPVPKVPIRPIKGKSK